MDLPPFGASASRKKYLWIHRIWVALWNAVTGSWGVASWTGLLSLACRARIGVTLREIKWSSIRSVAKTSRLCTDIASEAIERQHDEAYRAMDFVMHFCYTGKPVVPHV